MVRTGPARDSGRSEFAGAGVSLGGGHAALHPARAGRVSVGRERHALHRLRRRLGAGDRRARAPEDRGSGAAGGRRRTLLRRPHGAGSGDGRAAHGAAAVARAGAAGELGHRGHDERHSPGARLHGARLHRQVRGVLPRSRRRAARQGGLRRPHVRAPEFGRRARRGGARYPGAALQRSGGSGGGLCRVRRRDRRGDRGAGCRQHEPRQAASRFSRRTARAVRPPRRGAHLRRGDDGVSRGAAGDAGSHRHPARPHHAGQGDRRRHAGGRLRRTARDHGVRRPARSGVPGRHALRFARGGGRRTRFARARRPAGILRTARSAHRPAGVGIAACGRGGGRAVRGRFARRHVRPLFRAPGAGFLRRSDGLRRRALQALLSCHAGGGASFRALRLRGGVRLGGAH